MIKEGKEAAQGDFVIITYQQQWHFRAEAGTRLFIINTPARPSYTTYAEKYLRYQEAENLED
jgi:hypothetical protein